MNLVGNLLVVLALTSISAAQLDRNTDSNQPFRNSNNLNDAAQRTVVGPPSPIKLPKAVQVLRPLSVMPPKPVMMAPKDEKVSAELSDFSKRQSRLVEQVHRARQHQDHHSVRRLVLELDDLRQKRLSYLRPVAERITPVTPRPVVPDGIPSDGTTTRPVLPIPELPPRKRIE